MYNNNAKEKKTTTSTSSNGSGDGKGEKNANLLLDQRLVSLCTRKKFQGIAACDVARLQFECAELCPIISIIWLCKVIIGMSWLWRALSCELYCCCWFFGFLRSLIEQSTTTMAATAAVTLMKRIKQQQQQINHIHTGQTSKSNAIRLCAHIRWDFFFFYISLCHLIVYFALAISSAFMPMHEKKGKFSFWGQNHTYTRNENVVARSLVHSFTRALNSRLWNPHANQHTMCRTLSRAVTLSHFNAYILQHYDETR